MVFSVQMRWPRSQGYRTLDLLAVWAGLISDTELWKIVVLHYALVVANPTHLIARLSRDGHKLEFASDDCAMICPGSGFRYKEVQPGVLHCLDFDEESALPAEPSKRRKSHNQFKEETKYAGPTA